MVRTVGKVFVSQPFCTKASRTLRAVTLLYSKVVRRLACDSLFGSMMACISLSSTACFSYVVGLRLAVMSMTHKMQHGYSLMLTSTASNALPYTVLDNIRC